MEETNKNTNRIFYVLLFFAVIITAFIFKTMSTVFLPVIISIMLSFVLLPVIKKLNTKIHIPWILSSIIVIISFLIIFLGLSSLLGNSLTKLISEYPKYEKKFMSMYQLIAEIFKLDVDESKSFIENMWKYLKVRDSVQKLAVFLSSGVFTFGKNLFSISLMSIFLILELRITKSKLNIAFNKDKEKVSKVTHQIANDTVRYVSIKFFISFITGILSFFITWLVGMDSPVIWGFLAFIMNFIPIFGSIISVGLTTLFAILQFSPVYGKAVLVLVLLASVNITLGNIIEPRIEGKGLGISPFAILVSLSIWGYIWGFLGMLLAVPLTVIIKIICENIDYLKSIAIVIGNKADESL